MFHTNMEISCEDYFSGNLDRNLMKFTRMTDSKPSSISTTIGSLCKCKQQKEFNNCAEAPSGGIHHLQLYL